MHSGRAHALAHLQVQTAGWIFAHVCLAAPAVMEAQALEAEPLSLSACFSRFRLTNARVVASTMERYWSEMEVAVVWASLASL